MAALLPCGIKENASSASWALVFAREQKKGLFGDQSVDNYHRKRSRVGVKVRLLTVGADISRKQDFRSQDTTVMISPDGFKKMVTLRRHILHSMNSTPRLPTPSCQTASVLFRAASGSTEWSRTFCCKVDGLHRAGGRGTVHHQPPPVWDHPPPPLVLPSHAGMCPWNMCNFPLKLEGPEPWKAPQVLGLCGVQRRPSYTSGLFTLFYFSYMWWILNYLEAFAYPRRNYA